MLAGAIAVALLSGCSSNSSVVRAPSGSMPTTTVPTFSRPMTGSASHRQPRVRIVPAAGLADGQRVLVVAHGFAAGEAVQIVECAQKGAATGPGDCDLGRMAPAQTDANGGLRMRVSVHRGPFGANNIVCGPTRPCLISVTQASLTPADEADAPISFTAK